MLISDISWCSVWLGQKPILSHGPRETDVHECLLRNSTKVLAQTVLVISRQEARAWHEQSRIPGSDRQGWKPSHAKSSCDLLFLWYHQRMKWNSEKAMWQWTQWRASESAASPSASQSFYSEVFSARCFVCLACKHYWFGFALAALRMSLSAAAGQLLKPTVQYLARHQTAERLAGDHRGAFSRDKKQIFPSGAGRDQSGWTLTVRPSDKLLTSLNSRHLEAFSTHRTSQKPPLLAAVFLI